MFNSTMAVSAVAANTAFIRPGTGTIMVIGLTQFFTHLEGIKAARSTLNSVHSDAEYDTYYWI